MNTKDTVKEITDEVLGGIDGMEFNDDTKFIDDLGCDSLDCIEIIMGCEKQFGIYISDDDAQKCQTVKEFVELVDSLK